MKTKTVDKFIEDLADHYPAFTKVEYHLDDLKKVKFNKNECLFVWDLRLGEILFVKGMDNLLGFADNKVTLKSFTNLFHPEDDEFILRIGQAAIHYSIKYPKSNKEHCLYVSHRIKNAKGDYIKILAQSTPYSMDKEGLITSFLVKLNDISFVDTSETVQYKFMAAGLDGTSFHNLIFQNSKSIFTPRELDIIKEIQQGYTNPQIAERLQISKFTVATHRKKMMKKSNCHSAEELLLFCKKNGVI